MLTEYVRFIFQKPILKLTTKTPTNVVEHLAGVTDIPVERWKFRCAYCSSGKQRKAKGPVFTGACVQCAFSNCSYSFHATCVDPAGAETVPYIDIAETHH